MKRTILHKRKAISCMLAIALLMSVMMTNGAVFAQEEGPDTDPVPEATDEAPSAPDERSVESKAVKRWTFLVYMAADNNLESAAINDFLEMAQVGSTAYMNIVVQLDRVPGYDTRYGDWKDTRRFYITKNQAPYAANGTAIGEQNMGSGVALKNFINWAKTNYPAQKYALILWNHGSGFQPMSDDISSAGVAWDETSSQDYLTNQELSTVLSQVTGAGAQKLELVGFDACLMAQMEVHQHVKNYANYGVGSEKTEPNAGWPYHTILGWLKYHTTTTGQGLANIIADKYWASYSYGEMQSAVRYGTYYSTLVTRLNSFSNQMIARMNANPAFRTAIGNALAASIKLDPSNNFVDLYDFALKVKSRSGTGTALYNASQNLMNAISNFVTRNRVGSAYARAKGVTIFFPHDEPTWDNWAARYQTYQWLPRDTKWNEFLNEFYYNSDPFNSQFNGSMAGWGARSGAAWAVNNYWMYTLGQPYKFTTVERQNSTYNNLIYTVRMKRETDQEYANHMVVRAGSSVDATDNEWYPAYYFGYSNDGYFSVWKVGGTTDTPLQPWTFSAAVAQNNWNVLKVIASGTTFKFYINNTLVKTVTDTSLTKGSVGVAMYRHDVAGKLMVDYATLTIPAKDYVAEGTVSAEQEALNQAAIEKSPSGSVRGHLAD